MLTENRYIAESAPLPISGARWWWWWW